MGQPPIASSSWAKTPRPDENPKPSAHHEKPWKGCDFKGCDLNPKPSARMNPKPSAHHEKPYSAWALRLFVPCIRILLLLVFVPCIRILLLLVVVPWGCDFKGCDLKGCDLKGCDAAHHEKPYSAWALNPRPHSQAVVVVIPDRFSLKVCRGAIFH